MSSPTPPTELRAIRSRRVVLDRSVEPAVIEIREGRISGLHPWNSELGDATWDVGEDVVMAGLVDTHVHVDEPGRTDWEGFETATRAAAAGGVTTLVDMPLNSIPATIDLPSLEAKRRAASGKLTVDVGFWGGCVPTNIDHLSPLWDAGVLGFKAFLAPTGVEEFEAVSASDLERAAPVLAALGAPLLVHAEDPRYLRTEDWNLARLEERREYTRYLASRPPQAEVAAVEFLVDLAERHDLRVHVVHVAASEVLPRLADARARGVPITAETCPHYLSFAAEEVPTGATRFKCAPPVREARHREALWQALEEGVLDLVASDHSPSPTALDIRADGDFAAAWGGISGLQTTLSVVWTAARQRGVGLVELSRWLSREPARLAGLGNRKGRLAPGWDADLIVWRPEESFTVRGESLYHRHPTTPWEGRTLCGCVVGSIVRGRPIDPKSDTPCTGEAIRR